MSATDDVVEHIRGSLLDLRRRLDSDIVADIARAVRKGADEALLEMIDAAEAKDGIIAREQGLKERTSRPFFFRPN